MRTDGVFNEGMQLFSGNRDCLFNVSLKLCSSFSGQYLVFGWNIHSIAITADAVIADRLDFYERDRDFRVNEIVT